GSMSRAPVCRHTSRSGKAMLPEDRLRLPRRYTTASLISNGGSVASFRSSMGRASSAYRWPPLACAVSCILLAPVALPRAAGRSPSGWCRCAGRWRSARIDAGVLDQRDPACGVFRDDLLELLAAPGVD